jgi:hypothetical protein
VTVGFSNSSSVGNADTGIMADGAPSAVYLSAATVFGNPTGLAPINGGSIVSVGANNSVFGNGTNGSPTSATTTGAVGPMGQQGPSGAPGAPGQVVLVTCQTSVKKVRVRGRHGKRRTKTKKIRRCTARPITGTVTFTASRR